MSSNRNEQLNRVIRGGAKGLARGIEWTFKNHVLASVLAAVVLALLSSVTGHAQYGGTGPITVGGRSDQDPLKAGKALVSLLMWFMIIVGIVLWCMVPIMGPRKGNWFTYAAFGTVALGIGGWIALSHRVAGGETPELPDPLGH